MRKFSKILALVLATLMVVGLFAGCKKDPKEPGDNTGDKKVDEIYFLNFKPEVADYYDEIAKEYEKETGIKVVVKTAASGEYEQELTAEMGKKSPPTIFQINGPVGYEAWKDYCADLKDSKIYEELNDYGKDIAVKTDKGVFGIPYAVEGYGIIVNEDIMNKYFESDKKSADTVKSLDEIDNFAKLKAVAEDMTKIKNDLGIDGVFASTSMSAGNQWRWQTHLANIPMYYEFKDAGEDDLVATGLAADEVEFKYNANFKNIFDLYLNNSTTEKGLISSKSVDDSMAEFALGKAAMVQNGQWALDQIMDEEGNVVEKVKYLPIFTGVDGEEKQGLALGTENYFAINSKVDKDVQEASIDFLNWLFTSDFGKEKIAKKFKFSSPFKSLEGVEVDNQLVDEISKWSAKDGIETVDWVFTAFPSENFKEDFGAGLLEYAQDQKTWDEVVTIFKDSWKAEKAATANN